MKALIIANGLIPPRHFLRNLAASVDLVVCADGGANHARRLDIRPDIILGDLDSIAPSTRNVFKNIPLLRIGEQATTDLEKSIEYCLERGCTVIDIAGGIGNRIDHSTSLLGCFRKYHDRVRLREIDAMGELLPVGNRLSLPAKVGDTISLIPLQRCSGITTRNLQYPLKNGTLESGVRDGISNVVTGSPVTVTVKKGTLLFYRLHRWKGEHSQAHIR